MIFGRFSMNRTNIKGSITVEAIVMLGLIATMTPILYKHVAERREDIENINEANTLLLLKNATAEYIEANKESITSGILTPADIGVDISGYQIGIRKDSDGTINAMITGVGGNDLKAAKVAALLGVSAGIYSAQNTEKAWGINGVWAENISNYGFSSLPTGIPVITTAYDKEDASGLNEEQLKEFIESTTFDTFSTNKLCLSGECITAWEDITLDPLEVISACNNEQEAFCLKGRERGFNQTCQQIADAYRRKGLTAPNQIYNLTISPSATSTRKSFCWFKDQYGFSSEEILSSDCSAGTPACQTGYINNVNRSCQDIANTFTISAITPPNTGRYYLTSSLAGTGVARNCYFLNGTGWLGSGVITECNNATTGTCASGYTNTLNRSCQNIYDTNQQDGVTFVEGNYTLTASNSNFLTNQYCMCDATACYSAQEIIEKCNAGAGTYNPFCSAGYQAKINDSCEHIAAYGTEYMNNINYITTKTTSKEACCVTHTSSGSRTYDALLQNVAFIISDNIKTTLGGTSSIASFEVMNICQGKYKIELRGEGGTGCGTSIPNSAAGGIIKGTKYFSGNYELAFKRIKGGFALEHQGASSLGCIGGAGIGVWENSNSAPSLVVGGGGGGATGGGGYIGGRSAHYTSWSGYSWNGNFGAATNQCSSLSCSYGAIGGRTINETHYGGTALCGSGYSCLQIPGGNTPESGTGYNASDYGNQANGYASLTYCGNNSSACP